VDLEGDFCTWFVALNGRVLELPELFADNEGA